jgi:hypothetical protein
MNTITPKVTLPKSTHQLSPDTPIESKLYERPVYEDLMYDTDSNGSVIISSFDKLILNAERLGNLLGTDTARAVIDAARENLGRPIADMSNYDDTQLMSFIKSRNIQTPSELQSWLDAIDERQEDMKRFAERYETYLKDKEKIDAYRQSAQSAQSAKTNIKEE